MESYEEIHGIPEGLSSADVKRLTAEGKSNISKEKTGKSYLKIIADNVFTFFNLIWAIITVVLILCKSYENLTFLVVVVLNTLIAVVQEIKAKSTVERLSVTTDPRASVIRDGELKAVNPDSGAIARSFDVSVMAHPYLKGSQLILGTNDGEIIVKNKDGRLMISVPSTYKVKYI